MIRHALLAIVICTCIGGAGVWQRVHAAGGGLTRMEGHQDTTLPRAGTTTDKSRALPPRPTFPKATSIPTRTNTPTNTPTLGTPSNTPTRSNTATRTKTRSSSRTPTRTRTPRMLSNPSFELDGYSYNWWTSVSALRKSSIQRIPAISRSGNWLAVMGDANRETATLSQWFYVQPSQKELTFWYKITSTEACGTTTDFVRVWIGTAERWYLYPCKNRVSRFWSSVTIDLRDVAGKTTSVTFEMRTSATNPSTWFIDDVSVK